MRPVGPAVLVAAAFIGPGTVTTCILAGSSLGFTLVWALAFATAATCVLQEMAGRLGAAGRVGLGEALMSTARNKALRWVLGGLLVTAIAIGNAAYQAGNLRGGALGVEALVPDAEGGRVGVLVLAGVAGVLLWTSSYKALETVLVGLVLAMSGAFLLTAILVRPDLGAVLAGLRPRIPDGGTLATLALVGTTVVPYNLFLHAAASRERFGVEGGAAAARRDTLIAIPLGGLVSLAIMAAATASATDGPVGAAGIVNALEPGLGSAGRLLLGVGLLAAGLTSAVTAPMAAGFVISELAGRKGGTRSPAFRITALGVLVTGTVFALAGSSPVALITLAQAANGVLLPLVAGYLLWVMNNKAILATSTNGTVANLLGAAVILLSVGLAARTLARAAGLL